jgi:DNA modification methylase
MKNLNISKFMLINEDALSALKKIPDNVFHTIVTSPPYWQLRDYFAPKQLGQENTPEEYIHKLVIILEEAKRVLRKDGSLWLNIGDSYNQKAFKHKNNIKIKDLMGMPWKVALALQNSGWYLRCDIIYNKTNPLPDGAKDRPTRSHEYIFLLTKSSKYFYDYYATLEDTETHPNGEQGFGANNQKGTYRMDQERTFIHYGKRNKRSVWEVPVANFQGKHFATFSSKLIEPCILASTSEKGCCVECGTPWVRKFEKEQIKINNKSTNKLTDSSNMFEDMKTKQEYKLHLVEKGWEKQCQCKTFDTKSCLVLDPFSGMATTGLVSFKHCQNYVGIELNKEYLDISKERLTKGCEESVEEIFDVNDF